MKIHTTLLAGAVIATFSVPASPAYANETVRFGMAVSWPGFALQSLAQANGLVSDIEVETIILDDPLTGYSLLAAGRLDVMMTTMEYLPIAVENGLPFVLVTTTIPAYGVDQVVLRPGITEADIRGSRIAAPEAFIGQIFVAHWLDNLGIRADEVQWVNLLPDEAMGPVLSGSINVSYMYEPWTTRLVEALPEVSIVADSSEPGALASGIFTEVMFMRRDFISNNPEAARAALRAYWEGAGYWHEHTDESNQFLADMLGWPLEDVQFVMGTNGKFFEGGVYVNSFDESARICGVLDGEHPLGIENGGIRDAVDRISVYLRDLGMIQSIVDASSAIDCSLMASLLDGGFRQDFSAR